MNLTAIIAEYNPLHRGHLYHIETAKQKHGAPIVVLMSGNFVQRGEPAVFDKWTRTKMALCAGADMVVELPTHAATSSGEYFAEAAVRILNGLGCVGHLCFGTENDRLPALQKIAALLASEPLAYRDVLRAELERGNRFPKARAAAVEAVLGEAYATLMHTPNNILAIEYAKALLRTESTIVPSPVKRLGAGYHDIHLDAQGLAHSQLEVHDPENTPLPYYPSATALRAAMHAGDAAWQSHIPFRECSQGKNPVFPEALFPYIIYNLRSSTREALAEIRDVSEGFENRLLEAAKTARSFEELFYLVKTKRYTDTRVQRILLNVALGITKGTEQTLRREPPYARILGVKKESRHLLSSLSAQSRIPIFTNPAGQSAPGLALDVWATDFYGLLQSPVAPAGRDYREKLIVY